MATDNPPIIVHPTAVPRGRWYYAAGQVLRLAGESVTLAVLCLVLTYPRYLFSWVMAGAVALYLGIKWARGRAFFAAWAEVPGAFGRRRGWNVNEDDRLRPHATPVDYTCDVLKLAIFCMAGAWIAWSGHVPTYRAAAALAGFGAAVVVIALVTLARDLIERRVPRRADYIARGAIPVLGGVAWIALAALVDPAVAYPWAVNAFPLTFVVMFVSAVATGMWRKVTTYEAASTPAPKPAVLDLGKNAPEDAVPSLMPTRVDWFGGSVNAALWSTYFAIRGIPPLAIAVVAAVMILVWAFGTSLFRRIMRPRPRAIARNVQAARRAAQDGDERRDDDVR